MFKYNTIQKRSFSRVITYSQFAWSGEDQTAQDREEAKNDQTLKSLLEE